jgi:hypothetical protein
MEEKMALASNANNIRYNGTGRAYAGAVGGASFDDLGELETLAFSLTQSTEKMKSTRNASRATILEVINEAEAQLTFGLREMTNENLKMALMGAAINTANQSAGTVDADEIGASADVALVDDLYIDLGHLNVFSTKLTGEITGTLATGDSVTQVTSGATGKIAFKGAGFIELVNVSGTFVPTLQVYKTQDTHYIIPTGVELLEDVVITNAAGTARRVQGDDYTLDPDYGYIRKLSGGDIIDTDLISYDYEAVNTKYIHGMSAGSVQKKLIFVSDKDDVGVRTRWTFHKVNILMNGDFPMIGEGAAILSVTASVLKDATQPSGQEFYKVETIG